MSELRIAPLQKTTPAAAPPARACLRTSSETPALPPCTRISSETTLLSPHARGQALKPPCPHARGQALKPPSPHAQEAGRGSGANSHSRTCTQPLLNSAPAPPRGRLRVLPPPPRHGGWVGGPQVGGQGTPHSNQVNI